MSQFHELLPSTGGKAQSFTPGSVRATSQPQVAHYVALVLGGGGAAGNAWQIGVIAGLAEAGLDMTEAADLVVGTSSGAIAAAQVRLCGCHLGSRPTTRDGCVRVGVRRHTGAHGGTAPLRGRRQVASP